jgi:hypothetical protein
MATSEEPDIEWDGLGGQWVLTQVGNWNAWITIEDPVDLRDHR